MSDQEVTLDVLCTLGSWHIIKEISNDSKYVIGVSHYPCSHIDKQNNYAWAKVDPNPPTCWYCKELVPNEIVALVRLLYMEIP